MANALDNFYAAYSNNVILRDSSGNPSIFVRHEKVNSSDLNPLLPNHPHPAFMCGENVYDDAILIGKYPGSLLTEGGNTLYSLPNAVPYEDNALTYIRPKIINFGNNVTPITAADYGFLALLSDIYECAGIKGNTYYGVDYFDRPNGGAWQVNATYTSISVGKVFCFEGWTYQLLKPHTSSSTVHPGNSEIYWKRLEKIGGTKAGNYSFLEPHKIKTLTGSGPISWYFNNDMSLEADLCGGGGYLSDLRTYSGELQIIPYNQMADPNFNATGSNIWKAIKPHLNDDGCDFVDPGTEGTIKIANINGNYVLVARDLDDSEYSPSSVYKPITSTLVDSDTIPITPAILYEYAIAPLPGTNLKGTLGIRTKKNTAYHWFHGGRTNQYSTEVQDLAKVQDAGDRDDKSLGRPRARVLAST